MGKSFFCRLPSLNSTYTWIMHKRGQVLWALDKYYPKAIEGKTKGANQHAKKSAPQSARNRLV